MTVTLPRGTADRVVDRLFPPEPDPYDPVGWVRKRGGFLWSKQQEVCNSVRDHRFTAVRSAHGTGKSWTAAQVASSWLDAFPVGDAFVVTTAPSDKQVKAILWREIGRTHRKYDLDGRINLDAEWYMGQELVAYGRKPADYTDVEQARQQFQGIHAKYVLVILDEACGIPTWLWEATDTLVTNEHSRVLAIGNPDDPATEFRKCFDSGSMWNQIHISAFDLPWNTGERVPPELHDLLTGETWVRERQRKWGESSMLYKSKVLGDFPKVSEDTLITPAMIQAAKHNTRLPGLGYGRLGVDVARWGKDETAIYRNRGGVVAPVAVFGKTDTMETADFVAEELDKLPLDSVPAIIDVIGLGAGVYDRLRQRGYRVIEFNSSHRALEPDKYINRRAEQWWAVRQLFEDGAIAIDGDDEDLEAELTAIKWRVNKTTGRIQIEDKDETSKRLGRSPDRADAFMMSTVDDGEWQEALGVGRTHEPRDYKKSRTKEVTSGLLKEPT